ncbi:MAG: hypothetical protein P4L51_18715 [Puia sp.]|nr:hypothetical protein [Puia sp.]
MRRYKFFFTTTALASLLGVFCSCNKPNEHAVSFCLPDGKIDGLVIRAITAYALEENVGDDAAANTDNILKVADKLVNELHGGMPVSGTLILGPKWLDFKPMIGSSLVTSGCREIRIPMSQVRSVRDETYKMIYEAVIVTTAHGDFKFMVTPGYLGSSEGKDICKQVKAAM